MAQTQQIPYTPAVICQGLVKSFGEGSGKVMALRGIDITISRGERMMLVGPSGCGKTTLISIIAGILTPDAGHCTVLGSDLSHLEGDAAAAFRATNIGFIFQSYNLLPALTIAENVAVPLIINGMPRQAALLRAGDVLGEVGLGGRLDQRPLQLSGGEQQRVAIARALIHQPGVLVCDEPTSALDHTTGAKVMEILCKAVQQRGATLIIVTHDNRIFGYADRIAEMDDGVISRVGAQAPGAGSRLAAEGVH